jgi:hypothetical protein
LRISILISRAEPDNSMLEGAQAWSRKTRGCKLVVLGKLAVCHAYHRAVQAAASGTSVYKP